MSRQLNTESMHLPLTIDQISEFVAGLNGVLTLSPRPGDGTPEISWGDSFFYYAPDGVVPRTQPFATIVTKDYPDDRSSRLDRPDAFRVNIAAGRDRFVTWTGRQPGETEKPEVEPSTADTVIAHPVYGTLGWLAIVNPGARTASALEELLTTAYDLARARWDRRTDS